MVDSYALIDGAGPSYTPLRFGLTNVAEPVTAADRRWHNGFLRVPPVCEIADSMSLIACTGTGQDYGPTLGDDVDLLGSEAFWVFSWLPCSPVGWGDDLADLRARTTQALTNGGPRAAERVFWSGLGSQGSGDIYPYLAASAAVTGTPHGPNEVFLQTPATTVTSAAVDVVEALGLLEGALAECYGAEGVIHVPRKALAHLDHAGLVRQSGETLRTLSGNKIAANSGGYYNGPGRSEPAAGVSWFYATGAVAMFRGAPQDFGRQPGEIVGRDDNSTVFITGQAYAFTWDCCHLAAQVSLGGMITGTQGVAT